MRDKFDVEVDYQETLRNLARIDESRKKELTAVVRQTSQAILRNMKRIVGSEATDTGELLQSITAKRTRPRAYKPIPKDERGMFMSVHPRASRGGGHWPFTDSGTRMRRGGRSLSFMGIVVSTRTRGQNRAINFRERARNSESITFNRKVLKVAERNEQA